MNSSILDIDKFNIVQDEENYYFFRALNMADNNDIEQGITTLENGKIERIRTDRERFEGTTKYSEDSELSLEEIYDHIKMHYRKDTNCISLTSNSNVAVNYGRGSYKDRYVMIKIPKKEFGERTVTAGQYMLQELYSRIQETIENLPAENKQEILSIFEDIEEATESETLQDIIAKRYTAKAGEVNPSKAHPRHGITYSSPKARISSYQSLDEEQLLEVNKVYAKLAILENEDILKHVIPHSSNSKLRETIGNAFSSTEVIHYGNINEENIIEIPKEIADIFALIQQVNGIDKNRIEELKRALIIAVQNGSKIPQISDITSQVKDNISIEEMYELTEGKVEYGKANSIVRNMFYLSKARQNAISLSYILEEILGDNSGFEDIIQHIRENGFRVEPEIISRQSGKGVKLSESVNLALKSKEKGLVEEVKKLSNEELEEVLQQGGLSNVKNIINKVYGDTQNNKTIKKSEYYAKAIISQYNWEEIGIEEFRVDVRNGLIKRLQEKKCEEIYKRLMNAGVEEIKIPTVLLNIATRKGFYTKYEDGKLEELLNTRQDVLQENINIELVERFLGYYDVKNTGIKLKDYQQRAYDNVNKIFQDHKFAQVILPTGSGKSFVGLAQMIKYSREQQNEHPNKQMLYLAPQDEILNQIKKYIVKYVHGKQGTVGKTEDEIIKEIFPNITFETYSGLLAKRGQEVIKDQYQYGMIILDELHRTGAKEWEGQVNRLLENQNENVKVLGITATPVRDVDGRDMAEETAKKLGYTDEEIKNRKHLASNMTLENAIRMGYVVNPKLVYCKYDLISSGKMDELRARIEDIEDEAKKTEELQKYNELRTKLNKEIDEEIGEEARKRLEEDARKNLDSGIGKEEILRQNVKKGGKYIVFIPVTDQGDIEDEDGNRIGTKTGEDKILAYQEYLNKVFEGTDIVPELHSLLGSYSKDKNKEELDDFELDNSDKTKFMVVMNKANEGLHIDGVDGIIWFRALDENSRILYLQQLGRAIYALDEDNPLPDDKRPVIIDLANNSLTVKIEKEFENSEPIDDLEALTIVKEWIEEHDGMIPNGESSNKQEQHYYAILRRIQDKYNKYLEGFDDFEDLTDEEKAITEEIIELVTEIDLWNMDLPPIPKTRGSKEEFDPFSIEGVLKDFVEFEDNINKELRKNTNILGRIQEVEQWCKENFEDKPLYLRRMPVIKHGILVARNGEEESESQRESRMGYYIRRIENTDIYCNYINGKEDNLEDWERQALERYLKLKEEYDYKSLNIMAQNIIEIEEWCKEKNVGKCREKFVIPHSRNVHAALKGEKETEKQRETRLANFIVAIKNKDIYIKYKSGRKEELNKAELELMDRYFDIMDKYNINQLELKIDEIEEWCKTRFEDKPRYMRRFPKRDDRIKISDNILEETEEQKENRIAKRIHKIEQRQLKKYLSGDTDDLEDRDIEQIERFIKLKEEYDVSDFEMRIGRIEAWCEKQFIGQPKFMRRLPRMVIKNEGVNATIGNNEDISEEAEELRLGQDRAVIRKKCSRGDIKTEEEISLLSKYQKIVEEYDNESLNLIGEGVLELEEWCQNNKRMPKSDIKINGKKVLAANKGEKETEEQKETRLGRFKYTIKRREFYKKYLDGKIDELTIGEKELMEKYLDIVKKYERNISGQDIGKASYDAKTEKCDEAQAILERDIAELQRHIDTEDIKEGGPTQYDDD